MFALIDNYDSFTYNLVHYFGELGADIQVYRNDAISVEELLKQDWQGIILSPGPCDPDQAGICLDLIDAAHKSLPIFGVCLGHQSIGQYFGATIVRAPAPMHGKISEIAHQKTGVFSDVQAPLRVTRYHSLTIDPQFHPESIESEQGHAIMKNFLTLAAQHKGS